MSDKDHTQHQNSTNVSGDQDEKLREEEKKLNHNGQISGSGLEGDHVDTERTATGAISLYSEQDHQSFLICTLLQRIAKMRLYVVQHSYLIYSCCTMIVQVTELAQS